MINIMSAISQSSMHAVDVAWNMKLREEELAYRQYEIKCRQYEWWCRWVDEQWHEMEEKAKQLEQISSLSALLSGFALIAMCQMQIPTDVDGYLLMVFSLVCPAAVGCSLSAMLTSTLVLVAVMKYNPRTRQEKAYPDFSSFWIAHCEEDWRFSFRCFNSSIALFLMVLSLVGWIVFEGHQKYYPSASLVTIVAIISGLVYYTYTYRKWNSFLSQLTHEIPNLPPERLFAGVEEDWGMPPQPPKVQLPSAPTTGVPSYDKG